MGEIADMMISGQMCQQCGVILGDGNGYPELCHSCQVEADADRKAEQKAKNIETNARQKKVACPVCGKKVKEVGLEMHTKAVHQEEVTT